MWHSGNIDSVSDPFSFFVIDLMYHAILISFPLISDCCRGHAILSNYMVHIELLACLQMLSDFGRFPCNYAKRAFPENPLD
jgi:hypothetical protein